VAGPLELFLSNPPVCTRPVKGFARHDSDVRTKTRKFSCVLNQVSSSSMFDVKSMLRSGVRGSENHST
jgi:hypothetical protein